MIKHPSIEVLVVAENDRAGCLPLIHFLRTMAHLNVSVQAVLPRDLTEVNVLVTMGHSVFQANPESFQNHIRSGGGWLMLVPDGTSVLPDIFGIQMGPPGPHAEMRVLFSNPEHPLAVRLPDAIYLTGYHRHVDCLKDDMEVLLYADWNYRHNPVFLRRSFGRGNVAICTLTAYDHPVFQRIIYRQIREMAGYYASRGRTFGIGILGYAPSVGRLHGQGVEKTTGLSLKAVCDLSPQRRAQAQKDFSGLNIYDTPEALERDPAVELVIIATPPNTHSNLSIQMMTAGKHVVCEKPLALHRRETDAMRQIADSGNLHLSCHQNRRWDVDYLAIKEALKEDLIGDLFYLETFVGGYSHPCGYWHSHAPISGGTAYDWGAHYLDWIVSLFPDKVKSVSATRHKRVWHDVTNADQERVLVRFTGGKEAEFIHSDIAAIRKPKWYLLGTKGAIIGHWREVSAYSIDPLYYYRKDDIPPTEMTPKLVLCRRHSGGHIIRQDMALPERQHHQFHCNLADHLLLGEPLAAPLADSVRVVAILEAAASSAEAGGKEEVIDG